VRRATVGLSLADELGVISIHALREESDVSAGIARTLLWISIHALREESDADAGGPQTGSVNFYPRSP